MNKKLFKRDPKVRIINSVAGYFRLVGLYLSGLLPFVQIDESSVGWLSDEMTVEKLEHEKAIRAMNLPKWLLSPLAAFYNGALLRNRTLCSESRFEEVSRFHPFTEKGNQTPPRTDITNTATTTTATTTTTAHLKERGIPVQMLPLNTVEQMALAEDIGANAGLVDDPRSAVELIKEHGIELDPVE